MPARPRRRLSRRWSKVSKRFGIAGLAFGAWGLFYPRPLPLVVPLLAITPVIAVMASLASNRELDPFDEPERAFGLATFCLLPPISLSLVDLRFFPLLEGWRLLGFGAVSGVIIGLLYLKVRPATFIETRTSIWQQIAGWLGAIVYGWILVVAANGLGPQGARAVYKVPILKMRVESGKNTS
ncbi:hypothetical protein LZ016_13155 [Sphingomonas sp. SM33]|uniref:Uncharacterized protein n=1 Tax=Sphingomonas telluris TaxID=2907998 RepID=A0ABS9VQR7_9SPHN|nr:hypothetical protein [Sphingomonas telluris]MCH8617043.1 hypothetical protein [Sphingomonas telluris]